MPIGPKPGEDKCREKAKPIIDIIDEYLKKEDDGQESFKFVICNDTEIISDAVCKYISRLFVALGWRTAVIDKSNGKYWCHLERYNFAGQDAEKQIGKIGRLLNEERSVEASKEKDKEAIQ